MLKFLLYFLGSARRATAMMLSNFVTQHSELLMDVSGASIVWNYTLLTINASLKCGYAHKKHKTQNIGSTCPRTERQC